MTSPSWTPPNRQQPQPQQRRRRHRSASPPPIRNTGLFWFTTFLWAIFFASAMLLAAVVVQGYPGMVKQSDTDARVRLYRAKELVGIMKELRAGDYRLVRPSASEETKVEQHRWCPIKMASFLMTLCTSTAKGRSQGKMTVSLHHRGLAAEAIALCLTDQPEFRDLSTNTTFMTTNLSQIQQKQLAAHSLAQGLTVLLREGIQHYQSYRDSTAVLAMAQAAETVWIASFHYPHHIQEFLKHDTIRVLAEIIVSNRPLSFVGLEHPYPPARAVMWACAALQNLASSYCDNELGYCIWEWQEGGKNGKEPQLALDETVLDRPDLVAQARQQIASVPNLLETLADWICHVGPIHSKPNATYGWPGDAQIWTDLSFNSHSPHMQSPSIVPWAAAGVIHSLLLGKDDAALQQRIKTLPHLSQCLCTMMRNSPDWLEHGKATDAIYVWGPPSEQVCGHDTLHDNCQDDTTWKHAESEDTCVEYTNERWCIEYGEDVNESGKTANQACCACGGGHPKSQAEIYSDDPIDEKQKEEIDIANIDEKLADDKGETDGPNHEEL